MDSLLKNNIYLVNNVFLFNPLMAGGNKKVRHT